MKREFPGDENGDVLRRMRDSGDDLSKPRDIDFTVVLPGETQAETLAALFRKQGLEAVVDCANVVPGLPWEVVVSKFMVPAHGAITEFENVLQAAAGPLGGRNDGWGCFERPVDH